MPVAAGGVAVVRAILAEYQAGEGMTRNDLEEAFLAICDTAGVPRPDVNAWVPFGAGEGAEVDFLWRAEEIIVETDGRASHSTPRAFEWDRVRDRRLTARWRVLRFTWREVFAMPDAVAKELAEVFRVVAQNEA